MPYGSVLLNGYNFTSGVLFLLWLEFVLFNNGGFLKSYNEFYTSLPLSITY